ncbi:alpha-ribazole phosphatase family protein [Colwellia chukchiensis]|uniref:alpha-ribazole phosphatase family protein n=1 Tax=Colwellia chukchiensis TaxID=641665 RepID=UPI000A16EA9D|nr:alpha-ribazole phosphatase family protein [Colwellia chukchiensis]
MLNIYLLRHGELVQTGVLSGRSDIALSDKGQQQMLARCKTLPQISQCFSSPLLRCRAFAQDYCQQYGIPLQLDNALQEMDFGDWDGKTYQALWQWAPPQAVPESPKNPATLGDFWQDPWRCSPPNGETMADFSQRVTGFWRYLLAQLVLQPSANTLVVSHGGVIRYILATVLGLPLPGVNHMTTLDVPYGALIHLQVSIDEQGHAWPKLML